MRQTGFTNVSAAVGITNYYDDTVGHIYEGTITNSVLYGYGDFEIAMDTSNLGTKNFLIDHNVIKSATQFTDPFYSNILWNANPQFADLELMDYTWPASSPLNGAGNPFYQVQNLSTSGADIENTPRSITNPDAGAYEAP